MTLLQCVAFYSDGEIVVNISRKHCPDKIVYQHSDDYVSSLVRFNWRRDQTDISRYLGSIFLTESSLLKVSVSYILEPRGVHL